jgi:hypothetical protein
MTWDSRLRLDVVDDEIIITLPGTKTYKMMGKYKSEEAAMATMKECGR